MPPLRCEVLGLGQQRGQRGELGLAARQGFLRRPVRVSDPPVRPVWADRGEAGRQVALPRQEQRIGEGQLIAPPTRLEDEPGPAELRRQLCGQGLQVRLQALQVSLPILVQRLTRCSQLGVPDIELVG
jgi:hypothetical protein